MLDLRANKTPKMDLEKDCLPRVNATECIPGSTGGALSQGSNGDKFSPLIQLYSSAACFEQHLNNDVCAICLKNAVSIVLWEMYAISSSL